jgi:hypothetical protein
MLGFLFREKYRRPTDEERELLALALMESMGMISYEWIKLLWRWAGKRRNERLLNGILSGQLCVRNCPGPDFSFGRRNGKPLSPLSLDEMSEYFPFGSERGHPGPCAAHAVDHCGEPAL